MGDWGSEGEMMFEQRAALQSGVRRERPSVVRSAEQGRFSADRNLKHAHVIPPVLGVGQVCWNKKGSGCVCAQLLAELQAFNASLCSQSEEESGAVRKEKGAGHENSARVSWESHWLTV